jgi:hypothetical protein
MSKQGRRTAYQCILFCGLLMPLFPAFALEQMRLELGQIQVQDWRLEDAALLVRLSTPLAVSLQASRLHGGGLSVSGLRIECARLVYNAQGVACEQGTLAAGELALGQPKGPPISATPLRFSYAFEDGQLFFQLDRAAGLADSLRAEGRYHGGELHLGLQIKQVKLDKLADFAGKLIKLPKFERGGNLDLQASLHHGANTLEFTLDGQGKGLRYASPDGNQAAEGLGLSLRLEGQRLGIGFQAKTRLTLQAGEIYLAPFYFKQEAKPLALGANLAWQGQSLRLSKLDFQDPQVGRVQGELELALGQREMIKTLNLDLGWMDLTALYRRYLQTWLEEYRLGELKVAGRAQGRLRWQGKNRDLRVQFDAADLHDQPAGGESRFGLSGLNGILAWRGGQGQLEDTRLNWRGAHLLGKIALPAGALHLRLDGDTIRLQSPFHLALLDGGINLAQFSLRTGEKPEIQFSGRLEPISMPVLSKTFGLPELGGQLSGEIPTVRYAGKRLEIGGALQLQVFDGKVLIDRLTLREPFGDVPELTAEIEADRLDLATLTRYVEFGEMSGRLSGHVRNLHLVGWQPVAFDAYFATPAGDKSKRSISQKAINSLSSLGGSDVAAALSRSVLRIFEQFSYDRLGWGCKLENGRCQMRGVEAAPGADNAYYIVKGGGLPRIDVIGYNQQVDWGELLRRIKRVTNLQTGQAVVR